MSEIESYLAAVEAGKKENPPMDICIGCPDNDLACVSYRQCFYARKSVLEIAKAAIAEQSELPKGKIAPYLCGYQQGNAMALNAICDLLSGKKESVLERAWREEPIERVDMP
jgi:hypothetical protein